MGSTERLLYIAPKFPCVSAVFEQNEILGLRQVAGDLHVLSCRRPTAADRDAVHSFARPLLPITVYGRAGSALRGLLRATVRRPTALLRSVGWLIKALRNPVAFGKVLAAFGLALSWYEQFADSEPDWVHADFGQHTATTALFLGALLGVPFSFKVHAFDIFMRGITLRDPLRTLKLRRAPVIFSEHRYGRDTLAREMPSSARKIVVSYTAVRIDDFRPLPSVRESRRFVALGRLVPKKGFGVLVRAAAELRRRGRRFTVDIYGSGPEEARLADRIDAAGLDDVVRLQGTYENDQLPEILRDSVAVVAPSVITESGDMDGVPTVIYEAMALARPVIASTISGIPEIVKDGEVGLLVPSADARRLADAMETLLDDPDAVRRLGRNGREKVEQSHDHMQAGRALLDEMRKATGRGRAHRSSAPAQASAESSGR